jgi:hypothetical protein
MKAKAIDIGIRCGVSKVGKKTAFPDKAIRPFQGWPAGHPQGLKR